MHQHSTLYLSKQQSTQTDYYTIAACFPFETPEKCLTYRDIFPGLSRTLSFNFQDFLGPKWFSRTFKVLEFLGKKSRTFQEAWEPWYTVLTRWSSLDCGKSSLAMTFDWSRSWMRSALSWSAERTEETWDWNCSTSSRMDCTKTTSLSTWASHG